MNTETARQIAEELDRLGYIGDTHRSQREPWRILDEIAALILKQAVKHQSTQPSLSDAIKEVEKLALDAAKRAKDTSLNAADSYRASVEELAFKKVRIALKSLSTQEGD